jgi:hypothetical protein
MLRYQNRVVPWGYFQGLSYHSGFGYNVVWSDRTGTGEESRVIFNFSLTFTLSLSLNTETCCYRKCPICAKTAEQICREVLGNPNGQCTPSTAQRTAQRSMRQRRMNIKKNSDGKTVIRKETRRAARKVSQSVWANFRNSAFSFLEEPRFRQF